jgi:hypothetical protein
LGNSTRIIIAIKFNQQRLIKFKTGVPIGILTVKTSVKVSAIITKIYKLSYIMVQLKKRKIKEKPTFLTMVR